MGCGVYSAQTKVNTCLLVRPGTIIRYRSSHIPIFTEMQARDIIHRLRRQARLSHRATGMK